MVNSLSSQISFKNLLLMFGVTLKEEEIFLKSDGISQRRNVWKTDHSFSDAKTSTALGCIQLRRARVSRHSCRRFWWKIKLIVTRRLKSSCWSTVCGWGYRNRPYWITLPFLFIQSTALNVAINITREMPTKICFHLLLAVVRCSFDEVWDLLTHTLRTFRGWKCRSPSIRATFHVNRRTLPYNYWWIRKPMLASVELTALSDNWIREHGVSINPQYKDDEHSII